MDRFPRRANLLPCYNVVEPPDGDESLPFPQSLLRHRALLVETQEMGNPDVIIFFHFPAVLPDHLEPGGNVGSGLGIVCIVNNVKDAAKEAQIGRNY